MRIFIKLTMITIHEASQMQIGGSDSSFNSKSKCQIARCKSESSNSLKLYNELNP